MALYAIGDIHGCNQSFQALLQKIDLQPQDQLVLLGDYLDRGPDSKGVLDTIFDLRQKAYTVHCLRGNHEQIFIDAQSPLTYAQQLFYGAGGKATLDSFGVNHPTQVDSYYQEFICALPHFLEIDRFIFIHAGLSFDLDNPLQDPEPMLWERHWYEHINYAWLGDRYLVHGHTPIPQAEQQELLARVRTGETRTLNLDTGCVYASRTGMGLLSALNCTTFELIYQPNIDK